MKITIEGDHKEIAALALELQERLERKSVEGPMNNHGNLFQEEPSELGAGSDEVILCAKDVLKDK